MTAAIKRIEQFLFLKEEEIKTLKIQARTNQHIALAIAYSEVAAIKQCLSILLEEVEKEREWNNLGP